MANEVEPITAATECGPVRGFVSSDGIANYRSIPYAKSPVGALRWQPPVPLTRASGCWMGTLDVSAFAPACLQSAVYGTGGTSSEDCLKLHVWAPNATGPLPVIVWLHGGGLLEGSSFSIQSGYEAVARLPLSMRAIVIGVEYRLGVAGWLALDALAARDSRGGGLVGNYGLLDVLEALRWTRRNVAHFGGDPGRVTVCGQSSGGSLIFALLASPASHGLVQSAISLSGSPRLNSTTAEAASYWHRRVLDRTRCAKTAPAEQAACLLSLNATELLRAAPPEWHADVFGIGVFARTFQYAPLLLIDGPGGVLPRPYVDHEGRPPAYLDANVTLVVGATAQEGDFAPTDDVRTLSPAGLAAFLRNRLRSSLGSSLVEEVIAVYLRSSARPFEPQRLYSEIVADATVVCPNFYLAAAWQSARAAGAAAPIFAYRASQRLSKPFCVLRDREFSPPYCPQYSFHASDMFAWLRPRRSAHFNYSFDEADASYGELIARDFAAIVRHGSTRPSGWRWCATPASPPLRDGLPHDFAANELRLPTTPVQPTHKRNECALWLGHGFYERIGLIN